MPSQREKVIAKRRSRTSRQGKHGSRSEDEAESQAPLRGFAIVKPYIQHVPQDTVREKWEVVSGPIQDRIKELFKSIEMPVIMDYGDDRRRREAQAAAGLIMRSLGKHLPKIRFPAGTKDVHFDFETLLASNQTLDSQLTPATHTVGLLKAEIEREEQSLTAERRILQELETNSRAETNLRKRQAKKIHPILRTAFQAQGDQEITVELGLARSTQPRPPSLVASDTQIPTMLSGLRSHLDSIEANTVEATKIGNHILRTRGLVGGCIIHQYGLASL